LKGNKLNENLPINSSRPDIIHSGDIMLYGSNCVVLFYETFSTSYSYTPLGYIENPMDLSEAIGNGSVDVVFDIQQ
jgi:hypothetical protein